MDRLIAGISQGCWFNSWISVWSFFSSSSLGIRVIGYSKKTVGLIVSVNVRLSLHGPVMCW